MVVRRQRLFQPGDVVLGHGPRQALHRFQGVVAVAHAPPGVRVHHQVEIRTHRLAHQAHGFQILLRTQRRPHFVRAESQGRDRRGLGGVRFGRHIHAGAAVEPDAVAHPPAQQFRNRHAARLAGQIEQRDFHRGICLGQLAIGARPFQELHAQCVRVGQDAALQERRDGLLDLALRPFAARPRRITHQSVIGLHPDEHGVALHDGALAAVKGQADRLREGVGQQKGANARDLHRRDSG